MRASKKTEKVAEKEAVPAPAPTSSFTSNREHLNAMSAIASKCASWKPAIEVLKPVKAVPTIFPQLDGITRVGGWPIERFGLVHGKSNEGKALSVDTRILTPNGWEPIGCVNIGDIVIAGDGSQTRVIGVYPQGEVQLYRVTFSDKTSVECCGEHLWRTITPTERESQRFTRGPKPEHKRIPTGKTPNGSVKSLNRILEGFVSGKHTVPINGPVMFEPLGNLPLDPYLLGLLLGDGCFIGSTIVFHKPELDLHESIAQLLPEGDALSRRTTTSCAIIGGNTIDLLWLFGLMGCHSWEKFIPEVYMRASIEDRLRLLQGLCDTDGSVVTDGGAVEFGSASLRMAEQVTELARSLGCYVTTEIRHTRYTYKGEFRDGRESMRVRIYPQTDDVVPIASKKNLAKWKGKGLRSNYKTIVDIIRSRVSEAVCIRVESESHLYICDGYIVTHNTSLCHGLGLSFLQRGHFYLYVDAEYTTPEEWLQSIMAGFSSHPGFSALRPKTYEQTVDAVREFCEALATAKDKGLIAADTSGLIVVDSLRKLVPKKLMAAISKGVEDEEQAGPRKGKSRGVDGIGGRAGQLKAAMNAAWLDELVPLLAASGVGMIAVAREAEDPDAGMFDEGFKVGGGTAVYYDSSIVVRVCRDRYLREGAEDKTKIIGERHVVEIRKTKIGGKTEKKPRAFFHTSNGAYFKVGFCRAMDVLEAATDENIVEARGPWYAYGGTNLGQGLNAAAKKLEDTPELLDEIEKKVRASFESQSAE